MLLLMPLKGIGIHTAQPTDRLIQKNIYMYVCLSVRVCVCNVKYDMPAQKRYYAHKIFILCFWIYQFDVCAVYTASYPVSRLVSFQCSVRFTLSHFCSFYFNNFLLAFIVSLCIHVPPRAPLCIGERSRYTQIAEYHR